MNGHETEILDMIQNADENEELWLTRETFNTLAINARVILREGDSKPMIVFISKDGAVSIVFTLGTYLKGEDEPVTVQVLEVNYCSGKQIQFPINCTKCEPTVI